MYYLGLDFQAGISTSMLQVKAPSSLQVTAPRLSRKPQMLHFIVGFIIISFVCTPLLSSSVCLPFYDRNSDKCVFFVCFCFVS